MAKKKAAPAEIQESQPENEAQAALVDLMRAFDDHGVSIVEEQWRAFTDSERNIGIAWVEATRRGVTSMLPSFLLPFATDAVKQAHADQLEAQRRIQHAVYPCVFGKPSADKSEEGEVIVCMKIKVPDSHITGSKAREMFGKTRARIEFSRRPVPEWDQGELIADGPRRIVSCVSEIPSFGWADGRFSFGFRIDGTLLEFNEALDLWKNQGSIRLEILGEAVEEDDDESAPVEAPKKRGRPKKESPAPVQQERLPGTELDSEADSTESMERGLADSFSVALTDRYSVSLSIKPADGGRYASLWTGNGPAGECSEAEPSIRASVNQAAIGSIGRAIDYWSDYPDPESIQVTKSLRHWLKELEAGKSPALIESES